MATNDVPGYRPENRDVLKMGCWAETADGSLLLVEGVEAGKVIYVMFDLGQDPPQQYRDAQLEWDFKRAYSWQPDADPEDVLPEDAPKRGKKKPKADDAVAKIQTAKVLWTWHDKTPFPWDRVMKAGVPMGAGYASAEGQITAARKVAQALGLKAQEIAARRAGQEEEPSKHFRKVAKLTKRLERALAALPQ